jgi:DNA polymerase III epsilon subunit-like protein
MNNYIFYDLETNGLDYYTTGIMQITILDTYGEIILNEYIYPFDKRISCSDIHGIDEKKLVENNALQTYDLCLLMTDILNKKYGQENIYFVAYNNFGYDQIILENNFKHVGVETPNNWFFIDIFPLIKDLYPKIKPNFKLKTIFENICGKDDTITFHSSLHDTQCLYKLFKKLYENNILDDILIQNYTRPLLKDSSILKAPIRTLFGYNKSFKLEKKNFKTIGDIYNIFEQYEYNNKIFEKYIRNDLNIYSDFYINNILKQINVIKYFKISLN